MTPRRALGAPSSPRHWYAAVVGAIVGGVAAGAGFYGVVTAQIVVAPAWVWLLIAVAALSITQLVTARDIRTEFETPGPETSRV